MGKVNFKQSSDFKEKADKLFAEQKERILEFLPTSDIQHIGGTAIPGLLTKGDLDINVRVTNNQFSAAVEELKKLYEINQPNNWSSGFASFKNDTAFELPLGVQLIVIGSIDDHFIKHRDILLRNPAMVEEFNNIKREFEGREMNEYRTKKQHSLADFPNKVPTSYPIHFVQDFQQWASQR